MADLNNVQSANATTIIGSDSTGVEQTPVASTNAGALHTNLRNSNGSEIIGTKIASLSIPTTETENPTFSSMVLDCVIANNKSMLSLVNSSASGVKIKIQSIFIVNSLNQALTGIIADFRLLRIGDHSSGTLVSPRSFDTSDTLNANITTRTGATVTNEDTIPLMRWEWSTDEWGPGVLDQEGYDHAAQILKAAYMPPNKTKPLTLNPGEGFTIKQVSNSGVGTFDITIIYTQE